MSAKPTILDVAAQAKVSRSTASRALSGVGAVSPAARERVVAAAAALGYRVNGVARSMITGRTNTIGVVVADIENPFFARAVRGISDTARADGFDVILGNTDEDLDTERAAVSVFLDKRVDGIIVAPTSPRDTAHLAAVQDAGCALCLFDRRIPSLRADTVTSDNRRGAYELVNRLITAGHTRIALVGGYVLTGGSESGRFPISCVRDRVAGYHAALRDAGIDANPAYVRLGWSQHRTIAEMTEDLLDLDQPPTALVITDSLLLLAVIGVLRERGHTIPRDISVASFDDAPWAPVFTPPLTVAAPPAYDIGAQAARTLLGRIRGDENRTYNHVLPVTIIDRESIARPAAHDTIRPRIASDHGTGKARA